MEEVYISNKADGKTQDLTTKAKQDEQIAKLEEIRVLVTLPQDISVTASPTFVGETLTGLTTSRLVTVAEGGGLVSVTTDITAEELENLSDGSETALHSHHSHLSLAKAKMTRNVAQSIPHATTTKVLFDNEEFDVGGIADSVTNNRFDILTTGYYLIESSWACPGLDAGECAYIMIRVDGTEIHRGFAVSSGPTLPITPVAITTIYLTAGQYVEMYVRHLEGLPVNTDTNIYNRPEMSVVQLQ